jgi:hypothetical protein
VMKHGKMMLVMFEHVIYCVCSGMLPVNAP